MNKEELAQELRKLPHKERNLLKLVFIDCIPKVTLLWIYRIRYATLQKRILKALEKLR